MGGRLSYIGGWVGGLASFSLPDPFPSRVVSPTPSQNASPYCVRRWVGG